MSACAFAPTAAASACGVVRNRRFCAVGFDEWKERTNFVAVGKRSKCAFESRMRMAVESSSVKEKLDADAIVIGSGIGGLVTATQLAKAGAKVLVLEQYLIPGGSAGHFVRDGYTFDVGASMIFGLGDRGSTNLLTRALADSGQSIESIPDPVQIHYHLPNQLKLRVHRDFDEYLEELARVFPHEMKGLRAYYRECWNVFNSLNAMQLLSLEEPRYLLDVFFKHPVACLQLLRYFPVNAGDIARKYISDPEVLRFLDIDCYLWSVMPADLTPMVNAGMVFCDRHYGGIRYPKGGVGEIAKKLATGLQNFGNGSSIKYRSRVTRVLLSNDTDGSATGVELADGTRLTAKVVVSNATRWNTFEKMLPRSALPRLEEKWGERYVKSPSFLSLHLGVDAEVIESAVAAKRDCHHIVLEQWENMEIARDADGTLFVSIPSVVDPSVAPEGRHLVHMFTPSWVEEWEGLSPSEYKAKKEALADKLIARLEAAVFPGLSNAIRTRLVGTPRTHRRFLARIDGSYGPVPNKRLLGLLSMPFNRTSIQSLYCVGDSAFPGQGLNAVAFSGFACGHRVAVDLGLKPGLPEPIDNAISGLLSEARLKI